MKILRKEKTEELFENYNDESKYWSQAEAIEFVKKLEEIAAMHNHHVALTGGCLYKNGLRKDCDVIIYAERQMKLDHHKVIIAFSLALNYDMQLVTYSEWLTKAMLSNGKSVDFLCPEAVRTGADNY